MRAYTNAATIVSEDFADTEDLDGLFSGWDPRRGAYDTDVVAVRGRAVGARRPAGGRAGEQAHGAHGGELERGARRDRPDAAAPALRVPDPASATSAATRPRWSSRSAACRASCFLEVAEALCDNSGRERTSAFCYAVGWTQHTVGVQYIRTAAILQLLLGNIGRPGGGILALRGHASIQGSTDIPTLYNILPGYLPMPHARRDDDARRLPRAQHARDRLLGTRATRTSSSLLKAWWGDAATARERLLLRPPAAHHRRPLDLPDDAATCSTAR